MEQFLAQLLAASLCSLASLKVFLDSCTGTLSPVPALTILKPALASDQRGDVSRVIWP